MGKCLSSSSQSSVLGSANRLPKGNFLATVGNWVMDQLDPLVWGPASGLLIPACDREKWPVVPYGCQSLNSPLQNQRVSSNLLQTLQNFPTGTGKALLSTAKPPELSRFLGMPSLEDACLS